MREVVRSLISLQNQENAFNTGKPNCLISVKQDRVENNILFVSMFPVCGNNMTLHLNVILMLLFPP